MTVFRSVGNTIAGRKIVWSFGAFSEPSSRGGGVGGRFWNNGWARVTRPIKKSETREPRESDEIRCKAAAYRAATFSVRPDKVPCGAHTCWEGVLEGNASCEIREAISNIPT